MKKSRATLILFVSAAAWICASRANALVGSQISDGGPPGLCFLEVSSLNGTFISGCTGTLISERQVLTAAHCTDNINKDNRLFVHCGYEGAQGTRALYAEHFQIASFEVPTARFNPTHQEGSSTFDFSIINLDRPSKLAPIKLGTFVGLQRALREDANFPIECKAFGAGTTSERIIGKLTQGDVSLRGATLESVLTISTQITTNLTTALERAVRRPHLSDQLIELSREISQTLSVPTIATSGDSGGPILCRSGENGVWEIYGVFVRVIRDQSFRRCNTLLTPGQFAQVGDEMTLRISNHAAIPFGRK